MSRPLRIEYHGAVHHVTARGNARADIYLDERDRERFLDTLAGVVDRFGWLIHAYCLMDNHYHLLVETPEPNLAHGMRQLNGLYTQGFNRRHGRPGHVFQGRYKAILVERESHLLEVSRYVVLNPVRARVARQPGDWRWSSYNASVGAVPRPSWMETVPTLAWFGDDRDEARAAFANFVAEGVGAKLWPRLRRQIFLGSASFVDETLRRAAEASPEIPMAQRRAPAMSLEHYEATAASRNEAIRDAWQSGAYTLREIGGHFGLHYSTASRIANAKHKT